MAEVEDSGLGDSVEQMSNDMKNISEFKDFYNALSGFIFDTNNIEETEKNFPEQLQIFRSLAQNIWQIKFNKDVSIDELKTKFDYGYSDLPEIRRSQRLKRTLTADDKVVEEKPSSYIRLKKNQDKRSKTSQRKSYVEHKYKCVCDENDPCVNTKCYNRERQIECIPKICNAGGRKCKNRRFQIYDYPELRIEKLPEKQWSLFTTEDIERGDFVIEYVGEKINKKECESRLITQRKRTNDNNYYIVPIEDFFIDASRKGNMARFINHSCKPNCEIQYWTVNQKPCIGVFALVDIPKGTEITISYSDYWIPLIKKNIVCHCKEPQCLGFIGAGRTNAEEEGESPKRKATDDDENSDSDTSYTSFSKRSKINNISTVYIS